MVYLGAARRKKTQWDKSNIFLSELEFQAETQMKTTCTQTKLRLVLTKQNKRRKHENTYINPCAMVACTHSRTNAHMRWCLQACMPRVKVLRARSCAHMRTYMHRQADRQADRETHARTGRQAKIPGIAPRTKAGKQKQAGKQTNTHASMLTLQPEF